MTALQDKFAATRRELNESLIERETEIDLALTAIATREHFCMVGPAGVAKSLLADAILGWLDGPTYSELFTKFLEPSEVFGSPLIVRESDGDSSRTRIAGRDTKGMLPSAVLAFTDELFNGSSAILNTTLKILNERRFVNDGVVVSCPLWSAFAGSNRWPSEHEGGAELGALFDRFIFRRLVRPIASEAGRERLIWNDNHTPSLSTRLNVAELPLVLGEVLALPWSSRSREAYAEILGTARKEGIQPGDRRTKKSRQSVQGFAWIEGADMVQEHHLEILAHVLWDDPMEQPEKLATLVAKIANPIGLLVNGLRLELEEILSTTVVKSAADAFAAVTKLESLADKLRGQTAPRAVALRTRVVDEIERVMSSVHKRVKA